MGLIYGESSDRLGSSFHGTIPDSDVNIPHPYAEDTGIHHHHPSDHDYIFFENDTSAEVDITDKIICLSYDPASILDINNTYVPSILPTHKNNGEFNTTDEPSCPRSWDEILCWPQTPQGSVATLSCFSHFRGIPYDTSRTVSRLCEEGGIWQLQTNYNACVPLLSTTQEPDEGLGITIHIYFFGYCLSLTALIIAMIIFLSFKELRCLRNKIHTHLIVTYILAGTLWIITNFTTPAHTMSGGKTNLMSSQVSCIFFIILHYFHLTNFFMMFVEGLYLYVLVVETFMAENIKLRVYAAIGWGIPLLIMIVWSITKWLTHQIPPDYVGNVENELDPEFMSPCIIQVSADVYDWIYKVPVFLCLTANVIFLVRIMWVLITKLRAATSPETQQSRKAAKALIVLMPLLGITYVFILTGPRKLPTFEHLRALLISTQGFLVALLYCFLNGEVRLALRHRWNRWNCCNIPTRRNGRNSGGNEGRRRKEGCCSKVMDVICCICYSKGRAGSERRGRHRHNQYVRDLSPNSRSRTESNYFESTNHAYRKRASSSSEITTMSTFSVPSAKSPASFLGSNNSGLLQPLNPAAAKRLSMMSISPSHLHSNGSSPQKFRSTFNSSVSGSGIFP